MTSPRAGARDASTAASDRQPKGAAEGSTEVFIVRFWPEPRELETTKPEWRGVVEHVKSGERRFIRRPNDVAPFIAAYVSSSVPASDIWSRVRRWLIERGLPKILLCFSPVIPW
jgi:hypothetical protein